MDKESFQRNAICYNKIDMKNLSRNPYFYLSLVLAAALAFQVYGVVSAQTAEYKAPTQPPTGGMPAAPVNTGTTAQVKQGQFGIGPNSSTAVILESSTRRITFGDGNARGSIYLTNANGGELWVQHGANAAIKIGTGTGSGNIGTAKTGWTVSGTDVYNTDNGNVGVGVTDPLAKLEVGGDLRVVAQIATQTERAYVRGRMTSGHQGTRMTCDATDDKVDCLSTVRTSDRLGTVKYDYFKDESFGDTINFDSKLIKNALAAEGGAARYEYTVKNVPMRATVFQVTSNGKVMTGGQNAPTESGFYEWNGRNYVPAVLTGTWCGIRTGDQLVRSCNGYDIARDVDCPPGYERVSFGKDWGLGGKFDWYTCMKL